MTEISITSRDIVNSHRKKLAETPFVLQNWCMADGSNYPYAEQGRRLRWLRQAEGIMTGSAFAAHVGWGQPGYSQFETGKRRVPMDKALQLRAKIPGFDPLWLWEGDKRGLAFDLRQRLEAEETKEAETLPRSERQDV